MNVQAGTFQLGSPESASAATALLAAWIASRVAAAGLSWVRSAVTKASAATSAAVSDASSGRADDDTPSQTIATATPLRVDPVSVHRPEPTSRNASASSLR
jgi:hypothetical protein